MITEPTPAATGTRSFALPTVKPVAALRWSIAVCYLWFGTLKAVPGLSPAEDLAGRTVELLTFGLVQGQLAVVVLALFEVMIGIMLLFALRTRFALLLMLGHMVCTLTPVILLPDLVFTHVPYGLTIVGQYIVKNLVFMCGAWLVLRSEGTTA
ncbi:MAG: DoxX family membrane protein [Flavobacteriales bacterium]|nr:DoxX family membrane protein [Flavobacteriales bacterium]